jgi:hypothetical protein
VKVSVAGTVDSVRSTKEPGHSFKCRMADGSWYLGNEHAGADHVGGSSHDNVSGLQRDECSRGMIESG